MMSGIGPTLPPHLLAKRKRQNEDGNESTESDVSGSSLSNVDNIKIKRTRNIGPSLPSAHQNSKSEANETQQQIPQDRSIQDLSLGQSITTNVKSSTQQEPSPSSQAGRTKILGPALPPVSLNQETTETVDEEADSDDDFGPSLPGTVTSSTSAFMDPGIGANSTNTQVKSGRDDWMLAPPSSGDWTSRVDPSKMKNRGFSSGKGSRAAPSSGGDMSLWTETPEQKRKRLEDEMLGTKKTDQTESRDPISARKSAENAEMAKKVQAYNDRHRAAPMYASEKGDIDDDDPSKRAFDREKDIAGSKLTRTERKQMMDKAADFGSRFSKGTYL